MRRKMVNGVRETIAVLFGFKPGADAAALQEKLIKTFVDLLENVLIELEYSCAIASASNVVRLCPATPFHTHSSFGLHATRQPEMHRTCPHSDPPAPPPHR